LLATATFGRQQAGSYGDIQGDFMSNTAYVKSSGKPFATDISVGAHQLVADEPADNGGADTGPTPRDLLLAALGACTAITLRMYAQRKQWPLTDVDVQLSYGDAPTPGTTIIQRDVKLTGTLDDEQRQRLLQIANMCPLHKILTGTIEIPTKLVA
jgi:putative redox protein